MIGYVVCEIFKILKSGGFSKRIKRLPFLQKVYNLFVGWNISNLLQLLLIGKRILFYLCSKFMSFVT